MQWFKHDTNANSDDKLQEVLLDYGLEGYGLYWYCIELIVGRIDKNNITFELKHDARIIARNVGSTPQKVQEMMRRFIDLGLFEETNGHITCLKIARRLDSSMTGNAYMRELISQLKNHDAVMTESSGSHDGVMLEEKERKKDETRLDSISSASAPECPHTEIIALYHETLPMLPRVQIWSDKRKKALKQRWAESPERQQLSWWKGFFSLVAGSDFLAGKRTDFKADLEWLLTSGNFVKVVEGRYENREQSQQTNAGKFQSARDASLDIGRQIMGGKNGGTNGQIIDINKRQTIEGNTANFSEDANRLRKPVDE